MIKQAYFRGLMKVAQAVSPTTSPKPTSVTQKRADTPQAGFRLPSNINWQWLQRTVASPPAAAMPGLGMMRLRQADPKAVQQLLQRLSRPLPPKKVK